MNKFILFLVFFIAPLLYDTPLSGGVLAIELLLIFMCGITSHAEKGTKDRCFWGVSILFILFGLWSFLSFILFEINLKSLIRIVQIIVCYLTLRLARNTRWTSSELRMVNSVTEGLVVLMFLYWILFNRTLSEYQFIFSNSDTFGSVLLVYILILYSFKDKLSLFILLGLFVLLLTGSRANFLTAVFFIGAVYILNNHRKLIILSDKVIFILFITIVVAFIAIYPSLLLFDVGVQLDELSKAYLGKNLLSGRNIVWLEMYDLIGKSPIIGYGLSADPSLAGIQKSCHNTFIQTGLQTGIVGVVLLFLILYMLYRYFSKVICGRSKYYGMCLVMCIILHECFEICLTQNSFTIGIMMWFLLGLRCNKNAVTILDNKNYGNSFK